MRALSLEHKKRNVLDALPESKRPTVQAAMSQAYATRDAGRAKRLLENLARSLWHGHPGACASLQEGLEETLTVKQFDLPEWLERTLSTTNLIENLFSRVRQIGNRVRRWRDGMMVLRWTAAAALEAEKGFHRLRGHAGMSKLLAALRDHDQALERGGRSVDTKKEAA